MDEILCSSPISQKKGGKSEPQAMPSPVPTAQWGRDRLDAGCCLLRHLIRSHKKEKKKKRLFPRYSHLGPKIVGGRSERDIKLGIKNLPGFCFPKEKPKYTISCRIKYDGIEEGSPTSGCQKKRTENSSELYTRQERCPGGEGRGWYVGEPCN